MALPRNVQPQPWGAQLAGAGTLVLVAASGLASPSAGAQTLPAPDAPQDRHSQPADSDSALVGRAFEFRAPSAVSGSPVAERYHAVRTRQSGPELLAQVRSLNPQAFSPQGRDFIQAGLFTQLENARELVKTLEQRDIPAQMLTVNVPIGALEPGYRVRVSGDSDGLLERVRAVAPKAFAPESQGVIQAGAFASRTNARELADKLQQQGIPSQRIAIARQSQSDSQLGSYRVRVDGSASEQLERVREVVPQAFVPDGQAFIQAGVFERRTNARKLADKLEQNGISAQIATR